MYRLLGSKYVDLRSVGNFRTIVSQVTPTDKLKAVIEKLVLQQVSRQNILILDLYSWANRVALASLERAMPRLGASCVVLVRANGLNSLSPEDSRLLDLASSRGEIIALDESIFSPTLEDYRSISLLKVTFADCVHVFSNRNSITGVDNVALSYAKILPRLLVGVNSRGIEFSPICSPLLHSPFQDQDIERRFNKLVHELRGITTRGYTDG